MNLLDLMQLTDDDLLSAKAYSEEGDMIADGWRMTDKKSTVAHVTISVGKWDFDAHGSSRRVAGDVYDPDLGDLIAYTRALDKILPMMKREMARQMKAAETDEQSV